MIDAEQLARFHVVLTTFGVVLSDYKTHIGRLAVENGAATSEVNISGKDTLFQSRFARIVLCALRVMIRPQLLKISRKIR
jgi:dUTPase